MCCSYFSCSYQSELMRVQKWVCVWIPRICFNQWISIRKQNNGQGERWMRSEPGTWEGKMRISWVGHIQKLAPRIVLWELVSGKPIWKGIMLRRIGTHELFCSGAQGHSKMTSMQQLLKYFFDIIPVVPTIRKRRFFLKKETTVSDDNDLSKNGPETWRHAILLKMN